MELVRTVGTAAFVVQAVAAAAAPLPVLGFDVFYIVWTALPHTVLAVAGVRALPRSSGRGLVSVVGVGVVACVVTWKVYGPLLAAYAVAASHPWAPTPEGAIIFALTAPIAWLAAAVGVLVCLRAARQSTGNSPGRTGRPPL